MDTQYDSVDISQLKRYALNAPFEFDLLSTPNSRPQVTTINTLNSPSRPSQPVHRTAEDKSPGLSKWDSCLPPTDAKSTLPSTIPDSARAKMHDAGTQSTGDTEPACTYNYDLILKQKSHASSGEMSDVGYNQDDSGHIELVGIYDEQPTKSKDVTDEALLTEDEDDEHVELCSPDVRAELYPESQRFKVPKTPLDQGRKRKRDNLEGVTPYETPKLPINPFADFQYSRGAMDGSQIFEATQAVTSPNPIRSDLLYDRPSPNFNTVQRPSTADCASSPATVPPLRTLRANTEPQANYVSIKDSQAERERNRPVQEDDSSDDGFTISSQRTQNSPHRTPNRPLGRNPKTPPIQAMQATDVTKKMHQSEKDGKVSRGSPYQSGKTLSDALMISDDTPGGQAMGNVSEEETDREEANVEKKLDDEVDELANEDNKENVDVPRTVSRPHQRRSEAVFSQPTPSRYQPLRTQREGESGSRRRVRRSPKPSAAAAGEVGSASGTPNFDICDSQSSQRRKLERQVPVSSPIAVSGPHSSLDSHNIIPQSQFLQKSSSPVLAPSTNQRSDGDVSDDELAKDHSLPQGPRHHNRVNSIDELTGRATWQTEKGSLLSTRPEYPETAAQNNQVKPSSAKVDQRSQTASHSTSKNPCTIPETLSIVHEISASNSRSTHASNAQHPNKPTKDYAENTHKTISGPSTISLPFETAPEHLTPSPSKNISRQSQARSESNDLTPSRFRRRKTLGEITLDPSPQDLAEETDIDVHLMSRSDIEYLSTFSKINSARVPTSPKLTSRNRSFAPVKGSQSTPDNRPTSSSIEDLTQMSSPSLSSPPESLDELAPEFDQTLPDQPMSKAPVEAGDANGSPKGPNPPQIQEDKSELAEVSAEDASEHQEESDQSDLSDDKDYSVVAPRRVFAHFNGRTPAYYSATCLDIITGEEPRYKVRFDDAETDIISAFGIKRLELRAGDLVKIDLNGARSKTYSVISMKDRQDLDLLFASGDAEGEGSSFPKVDIHGYTTVVVAPKSLETTDKTRSEEHIEVSLEQIYITQPLWGSLRDREYNHYSGKPKVLEGLQTPSERPSTPATPSSRARRVKSGNLQQQRSLPSQPQGIFKNMVFTLTNINTDLERTRSLILTNGGSVLEDGFSSLFRTPTQNRSSSRESESDEAFHLLRAAESIGFTCLIADKHCRTPKYMQALALGIPCLASRWLSDCVGKDSLLPWSAYLLPAGESAFLGNGAIRSRVLPDFEPESATLTEMFDERPLLFEGSSVLLITRKGEEDNAMKQFPLLIFAMGSALVATVTTLDAAAREVKEAGDNGTPWDLVVVSSKEGDVERALFGNKSATSSKRKRGKTAEGVGNAKKTKLVDSEFLIQSLISGRLIDE